MARTLSMLFSDLTSHVAPIVSAHNDEDKVKWRRRLRGTSLGDAD